MRQVIKRSNVPYPLLSLSLLPAILNAVHDATGIRFRELPLTPERVFMAMKEKREAGNATFAADAKCAAVMEFVRAHKARHG